MPPDVQPEYGGDKVNLKDGEAGYGRITPSQCNSFQYFSLQSTTSTAYQERCGWGARYTFALLSFLGFANMYAMRANLSVAIVAMVNDPEQNNNTNNRQECPIQNSTDTMLVNGGGNFDWDSKEQASILGAFSFGYVVTQIPGGLLAEKYGGKWFYGLAVLCTSVLTLLIPLAAEIGVAPLVVCRILAGLGEGMAHPAMHAMISRWAPLNERSKLVTFIACGAQVGTVVSLSISGVLAAHISWQSVFYFFGVLGCIWFVFWVFLVFNTPQTHPRISSDELEFIESNIIQTTNENLPSPPIRAILSTPAFWALIIAHCGQDWGFYTLFAEIPTYLKNVQHFGLEGNGLVSAVAYLCMTIMCIPFSIFADWLISTERLSLGATRKLMQTIGQMTPALGLVGLSFVGCNPTMAVVWLCICVGFNGASYSGFQATHIEMSPNYSGTLMGITNMLLNVTGFVTPHVCGVLVNNNHTLAAWKNIFLISSGAYVLGNLIFALFGSTNVQVWNTYWM